MPASRRLSPVLVAAIATALVRVVVAMSRTDEIELELYGGSMARALLEGMPLDPEKLPVIDHLRGSVLFGVLAVPLFVLLGPRLLALKVLAIAWSVATAALFVHLLDRHVSRRAAWVGALGYALLPPSFQIVDVLALGSHGETILFVLGALALVLARSGPDGRRRCLGAGRSAALGLVCGLGVLFSLQFVVALPAILLAWLLRDRRFPIRPATILFVACLALAAAPTPLLSTSGELVTKPPGEHVRHLELAAATERFLWVLGYGLPRSWLFAENGGAILGWLWGGAALVGLGFVLARLRRGDPLAGYLVLHPLLFAAAYAVSDFDFNFVVTEDGMGSRYGMPVQPCLLAWTAIGVEGLARSAPFAARAVAVAALGAGLGGVLAIAEPGYAFRQPTVRGTEIPFFHGHVEHAAGPDPEARLAWILRLEPDWEAALPLACVEVRVPGDPVRDRERLDEALEAVEGYGERVRPFLLARVGLDLGVPLAPVEEILPDLRDRLAPGDLRWILRGIGRAWIDRSFLQGMHAIRAEEAPATLFALERLELVAPELRPAVVQGMGFWFGHRGTPYQPSLLFAARYTEELGPELERAFYRAAGFAYRSRFLESEYEPPEPGALRFEAELPERARAWFHEGLALPADAFPEPPAYVPSGSDGSPAGG